MLMSANDLLNLFQELDDAGLEKVSRETVVRSPFPYPGGKTKSIKHIIQHLPYRNTYVEPFGGSGAILLARQPCKLEVFNDRYAGVVALYRCIRDAKKCKALVERLSTIVHSREEFVWCSKSWETYQDDVERAARWYYVVMFSFGRLMRNFGRATSGDAQLAAATARHILEFDKVHNRIKFCLIENQDWRNIVHDFDNEEAVFYLDPPYYMVHKGTYKHELTTQEHRDLLNHIMKMQSFVAISGYHNELYDSYDWDEVHEWDSQVSIQPMAFHEENNKAGQNSQRSSAKEVLWIKR